MRERTSSSRPPTPSSDATRSSSLLLASEAAGLVPGDNAERSLRQALLGSRVRAVVDTGEPLLETRAQGDRLVAVSKSGDLIFSDPVTGDVVRRVSTKTPRASDASFSDRGSALVTGSDGRVRIVSRDGNVRPVAGVEDADRATISADGTLALVTGKGGVRLLDLPSGRVRETYPHPGAESAAISFDNRRVVTGGADQRLLVWSGQSGRRIHSLIGQFGHPTEIAFSPDGTLVASASSRRHRARLANVRLGTAVGPPGEARTR